MDKGFTGISLIIPFYDDIEHAQKCLNAICRAIARLSAEDSKNVEIIIVDDASPMVFPHNNFQVPLIYHRMENESGVGAARNKGGDLARYSHLFFIDSDVVLDDDYLCRAIDILKHRDIKILQGTISVKPANASPSLFHYYMAISWHFFLKNSQWPSFLTLCMVFERSFFLMIGGFSEDYKGSGGEEFEIVGRLGGLGNELVTFEPSLIFYHHYDELFVRLRKVFNRSTRYKEVLGRNKGLPLFFKTQVGVRLSFSLLLSIIALYSVSNLVGATAAYCIVGVIFFLADWKLSLSFWRHYSWRLALASIFFRQMEYLTVFSGILWGMVKKH